MYRFNKFVDTLLKLSDFTGMWFMQKWKKSGSLLQLSLRYIICPLLQDIIFYSKNNGLNKKKSLGTSFQVQHQIL
jgi:hypothetical protein